MNEEMRVEAMELCVTACEKHASSNEVHVEICASIEYVHICIPSGLIH